MSLPMVDMVPQLSESKIRLLIAGVVSGGHSILDSSLFARNLLIICVEISCEFTGKSPSMPLYLKQKFIIQVYKTVSRHSILRGVDFHTFLKNLFHSSILNVSFKQI